MAYSVTIKISFLKNIMFNDIKVFCYNVKFKSSILNESEWVRETECNFWKRINEISLSGRIMQGFNFISHFIMLLIFSDVIAYFTKA